MSKQEASDGNVTAEAKQLTGSSKRKRKSSVIKHNVVNGDKSDGNDNDGCEKPMRTYAKRAKSERGKGAKDKNHKNEVSQGSNSKCSVESQTKDGKDVGCDGSCESNENQEILKDDAKSDGDGEELMPAPRSKGKTKSNSNTQTDNASCTGKQQCQNCTFCAEHKTVNTDKDAKSECSSKTFSCKVCSGFGLKRVYNSLEKLKRHTKEAHEPKKEVKRFECTECPEPVWFPTKSKFCYHLGAKHPGIIKFVCEVCTQTFKLKANYKNHLKAHNIVVQKKFSCDVCGGTFVNRAGFEAHKKRFPGPHIKQSCTHCGVSFSKEKHMKNHRCKILLLEEAAARDNSKAVDADKCEKINEQEELTDAESKYEAGNPQDCEAEENDKGSPREGTSATDEDGSNAKTSEGDPQGGKKVLFHRLLPKKNEKLIYRQFPLQTQNVPQSVVVQEFREIDFEGGAFIAADPDQIIVRDVNGHLVQGNQILQLDINEFQPGEESQVYLADWNVVAPLVIRGKSP